MPSARLAGLEIFSGGIDALIDLVKKSASSKSSLAVHFISANSVWVAQTDRTFRAILNSGGLMVPDSKWAELGSGLGGTKAQQTRGPEVFRRMVTEAEFTGLTHFFIGPNNQVNGALQQRLETEAPSLTVGGYMVAPFAPFDSHELDSLANFLGTKGPAIVWVGIGTPAQDVLASELAKRVDGVFMAVGAAFEFMAGLKPEAPEILSRLGLEWLFRLVSEPQRLWKRYLVGNSVFVYAVVKHAVMERVNLGRRR